MNDNDNDNIKTKTISGMFWQFGERILAQLVSFIVSIILARLLFPEDYAIVAFVTIFIMIANTIIEGGLGTALVQKKNSTDLDFSTIFWSSIIVSLIMYAILFFLAPLIADLYGNDQLIIVLRIMCLRFPIGAINSVQHAYVQKKMIFRKFFFSTLTGTIISAGVGIWMAYNNFGVWALVAQYLLNGLIDTIFLSFLVKWKPKFQFSFESFKSLFSYGWKVMAASFIGSIFDELRQFLIGIKYDDASLAYYNRGNQIPQLIASNINSTTSSVAFPALSKVQDDAIRFKNYLRRMIKTSAFVLFPMLFGLAAVAEPMTLTLLTEKWIDTVPYIQIICFGAVFTIFNGINTQTIKALGRSDTLLKLEFIKKPLYLIIIVGCMFISPIAIAIGHSIYTLIGAIINSFPNKKLINYSFGEQIKDVLIYLLISVIMGICVFFMKYIPMNLVLLLIIQVVVGIVLYLILCVLFKVDSLYYVLDIAKNFFKRRKIK